MQTAEYRRDRYTAKRAHILATNAAYKLAHKAELKAHRRARYLRNKAAVAAETKAYRESHPEMYAAAFAKRRASRRNATPAWADPKEIAAIYARSAQVSQETGIPHEVDHIVPLQHRRVCGLHCPANMQVITQAANRAKANMFEI